MIHIRRICLLLLALLTLGALAPVVSAQQYPENLYQGMRWRLIGPFRGGRTKAISGVASEPNVFYIAQVDGGVWKSTDYGETWKPIFDAEPTQSIGALEVAPSDPNTIYAGSGEGLQRPDLSVGNGIYKSTDAGKTWTHVGLSNAQQVSELAIDPRDPNRVFVAVFGHPYGPSKQRGIFRTTDGGQTWQKVLSKDEYTGGGSVEIDPSNSNVVYASLWDSVSGPWEDGNEYNGPNSGLYKSTDGGATWNQLTQGMPAGIIQVHTAIAPSQPSRVYAAIAHGRVVGIYRSDDAGATWSQATTDRRPTGRIGGGDLPVLRVDPKNADIVYATSTVTWKSIDGGKTWSALKGAPGGDDYQNIWINPNNPHIILLTSDQGAVVSVNGGKTWSSWYNQPTAQFYHVITDNRFPYWVYGGQQESGSIGIASRGNDGEITFREWHPVGVIEYGYVAPDPLNPNIVYGAGRTEVSKFNWVTGQVQNVTPIPVASEKYRADRTQPIIFSPVDPHILYYAANVLFKTINGGQSWQIISPDLTRPKPGIPASLGNMDLKDPQADKHRGAIYSIGPSPKDVNLIWAGTDDGLIWVTHDGGKNWKNVTPPALTPWSKVTQIVASHFDVNTAFASVSRFRIDDMKPYIYRTDDGGKHWQLISDGLPGNQPVNTVREDPVRRNLLFAGTENAVWVSFDAGDHWQSLQLNLSHSSMRDLWIHGSDLVVGTHGRGFWILDDITPLRQITDAVVKSDAYLFQPAPAYRYRRDTNTDTPLPPEVPAGENPPNGAVIDYYLANASSDPVTLEIFDHAGKLVRRYSSADQPPYTLEQQGKTQIIPTYWIRKPRILSSDAGMHRWVWNLHYTAPKSLRYDYPIAAVPHDTPRYPLGPRAVPGVYTVKLTADGRTYSQTVTVKEDPRVHVTPLALGAQFAMERRLASGMDRSYNALQQVKKFREDLKQRGGDEALDKQAASLEGGAGGPGGFFGGGGGAESFMRMNFEFGQLYAEVDGADAAPTLAQDATARALEAKLAALLAKWKQMQAKPATK
ncbi:MAG: WD40/YVTN/BNR-like repeat-containing protein [Candidatus Acidiferrales bacterium]